MTVTVDLAPGAAAFVRHGETASASVGDRIWLDANWNGIFDAGEVGIANVTVRLQDRGGVTIGTTVTDGSGVYRFSRLLPGTYRVLVDLSTVPAGFVQFADPDATFDGESVVTVGPGEMNAAQNFAFALPAPVPVDAVVVADPPLVSVAFTGANVWLTVLVGLGLAAVGALLTGVARRRRGRSAPKYS